MDGPKLSIITPIFNVDEKLFVGYFQSIAKQNMSDFEVLLVDDGSEWHCLDAVQRLIKGDDRFRLLRQGHLGVSAARNLGLQEMRGAYCTFIDADDEMRDGYFSTMIGFMEHHDLDAAISDVTFYWSDDKQKRQCVKQTQYFRMLSDREKNGVIRTIVASYTPPREFRNLAGVFPGGAAKFYKSSVCKALRFNTSMTRSEDCAYCVNAIQKSRTVGIVDDSWYLYKQYQGSATKNTPYRMMMELPEEISSFSQEIPPYEGKAEDLKLRTLNILLNYLPQLVECDEAKGSLSIIKRTFELEGIRLCKDLDEDAYIISCYRRTAMNLIKNERSLLLYLLLKMHNIAKGMQ